MDIRIYNAQIMTMAGGVDIAQGEVWVRGDTIAHVGAPRADMPAFEREIDARGNLLLPGFKNAHTHSAMTFLRSFADDLPLLEWLERQVFPMEAKLTEEDVYHLCRLAIMEYLTSGITANFDMYLFPEAAAKASADCGFRTVLCGGISRFVGSPKQLEEDYARLNAYHPLIGFRLGFHAEYTATAPLLADIAALAKAHRAPVYTHNSESRAEVESCLAHSGKTPTAYLDGFGLFDYGGGGFHCVYLTDADMEILRARGVSAITNPGSNTKLASGIAPLCALRKRGVNLAIGTDGPASNNCLDMFREMFLATGLQKLREDDAAAMEAGAVLIAATVGGARAMGLSNCDILAVGKQADLVMIDLHMPNMQPVHNPAKNLVYSGSKQNVALTMVAGRILYERGQFLIGCDPEAVYAKANEIADRITGGQ